MGSRSLSTPWYARAKLDRNECMPRLILTIAIYLFMRNVLQGFCDARGIARTLTVEQIQKMAVVAVEFVGKVLLPELDEMCVAILRAFFLSVPPLLTISASLRLCCC